MTDPHVYIVGGGPAGLATAIALRQQGFRVTVADCAVPPIDKACGEGLLPDTVQTLSALGISIPESCCFPFRGIRFSHLNASVVADFPNGVGLGVRRTILHTLLLRRAEELGASFIWNSKHLALTANGLSLDGKALPADFVVGADGQNSRIRHQAGLHQIRSQSIRYAFRRHYRIQPWSPYVELCWGPKSQIYITPVSANELGVALTSSDSKLRLDGALADFPDVAKRLAGAKHVFAERGALSISREFSRVSGDNIALVGDASGSVDAITGEGIGLSFRQALAFANALKSNTLSRYEAEHRSICRRSRIMGSLMLVMDNRPTLQHAAITLMEKQPKLFSRLLAFHVGGASMRGRSFFPLARLRPSHDEGERRQEQDHERHYPKAVLKT